MKHLYYIRHGQSQANADGIWSGRLDTPLSNRGIKEAQFTGKTAKTNNFKADLIITSPLIRASKTAEIVASYIGYNPEKIRVEPQLMERSFGNLEGTPIDTIMSKGWNNYKVLDTIDTVEKLEDLQKRAAAELEKIKKMPEDIILITGHAAFGRALKRLIAGKPYTDEYVGEFSQIPNAEIVKLI